LPYDLGPRVDITVASISSDVLAFEVYRIVRELFIYNKDLIV